MTSLRKEKRIKENTKKERLEIRLSQTEKEKLARDAKRSGISVSAYVRRCCMDKAPKAKPPDEFWQLLEQVYALYDAQPPAVQAEIARLILSLQEAV